MARIRALNGSYLLADAWEVARPAACARSADVRRARIFIQPDLPSGADAEICGVRRTRT